MDDDGIDLKKLEVQIQDRRGVLNLKPNYSRSYSPTWCLIHGVFREL